MCFKKIGAVKLIYESASFKYLNLKETIMYEARLGGGSQTECSEILLTRFSLLKLALDYILTATAYVVTTAGPLLVFLVPLSTLVFLVPLPIIAAS